MDKINASHTQMQECFLFGRSALFTPHKVSRTTVHLGFFCYEIQARQGHPDMPFCLTSDTEEDLYGTILTLYPVELPPSDYLVLEHGDFYLYPTTARYTPALYEHLYHTGQL